MIENVVVTPLRQIADERGKVMHMLKATDAAFRQFGEIYFSSVNPGAVKAWHLHKEMWLNYAVPHGSIRFVLYDARPTSSTHGEVQEFFLGPDNYCLVTVPPRVWSGFEGLGADASIVANCATLPHAPDEIARCEPQDPSIPYDWTVKRP